MEKLLKCCFLIRKKKHKLISIRTLLLLILTLSAASAYAVGYVHNEKPTVPLIKKISGTVVDQEQNPIPGVNIAVKGTSKGTISDIDGKYSIDVPDDKNILIFSFVGMQTMEVEINNRLQIDVVMETKDAQIDDVVVTGYQKIDRKLFTGSAVKVEMEEIKLDGVADISRSLQGEVAGVEIENVSGTFGTAPVVRVRGNASINGTNKPLWVVDGVVLEDAVELTNEEITSGDLGTVLSSSTAGINPEDIESFQVLKDASATALYGARAMNGVIVITTKKGKAGAPTINFTSSTTLKSRPTYSQFNILNSGAEMSVYQELYEKGWIDIANSNTAASHGVFSDMFSKIASKELSWGPNGSPNYDYLQRYANANTDWFDVLFKNSLSFQNSLSITSGTDKANYRVSIGAFDDMGQTLADRVKNYTGSVDGTFNLTEKFRIGFQLKGNVRDQEVAASENRKFDPITGKYERNFDINPFNYALYTSRSMTPYDEDGNKQFFRRNYAPFNILHELDHNKVELDVSEIIFQTSFDYNVLDNLSFRTSMQGRWWNSEALQSIHENSNNAEAYRALDFLFIDNNRFLFDDPDHPEDQPFSVLPNGGFRKTTKNSLTTYYMRNTLEYSPKISEDHFFNVLIGQEIRYNDRSRYYIEGWGYMFDKGGLVLTDPSFIRYLDARGINYFSVDDTRNRSWGSFINLAYSYKGKYIFNGTFRYDGDNRTGKSRNARYLPTWNVSGAWNLHSESWMEQISWLDILKIKSTYGLSGDNPLNASAALILRGDEPLRPHITDRETALFIEDLENSELTFEKLYEFNAGVEFSVFNNRVYTEFEYYNRNSKDLLGTIETNGVGGVSHKYGNVGEKNVNGIEGTIKVVNIRNQNFKWTTSLVFSYAKDKITKWESVERIGDAINRNGANLVGYPQGALFSIPFAGLDENGVPTFYEEDGEIIQSLNLQERENITKYLKYEGPTAPLSVGSLNNSFRYKNISFSFSFVYRYGNKIRLDDAFSGSYSDYRSLPGDLINRWSFPGDEDRTIIPAIITPAVSRRLAEASLNPYEMYNKSDVRVADGDFVRLKSIKLTYNFPNKLLSKTFIKSANVSASAFNLWLLYSDSKLNGIDPEFFQSGGISLPMSRSYTLTLNLRF